MKQVQTTPVSNPQDCGVAFDVHLESRRELRDEADNLVVLDIIVSVLNQVPSKDLTKKNSEVFESKCRATLLLLQYNKLLADCVVLVEHP